ncbi:unnamed protein product [Diplocarpon coronariae]|uniref:Beta-arrestin 2 short isoform n=1 Tax=Diplocarpon coronariae TaxID=2795749 RepID=A0A218YV55_9HELO|nr:hypothetical protein JHW43_001316 [Diplocarpon mali]OWO99376.1 beta-arrestin 2 short isoform [Marssonina coronariae]
MNVIRNNSAAKPAVAKYRSKFLSMMKDKEPTHEQADNVAAMIGFQSNDNIPSVLTFSEIGSEQRQEDSDENVAYIPQDSRTMGSWSSFGEFDIKLEETMNVHPCNSFALQENIGGSYDEVPHACGPIHSHYTRQSFPQPQFVGTRPADTVENYNSLGQCLSPISIEIGTESSTESKTSVNHPFVLKRPLPNNHAETPRPKQGSPEIV